MALEDTTRLPSGRDLPSSDGVPMESDRHADQARQYLIQPLRRHFEETGFVAWVSGNSFVYYPGKGSRAASLGPDMYVVNGGVPRGQEMWVTWEEGGLLPTLIVELVSPSTVRHDRGRKFRIYRDVFQCPDYFLYNTTRQRLEAFRLEAGFYLSVLPDADGGFPCSSLPGLRLGVRDGWLRFILPDGSLLLTGDERAEQERLEKLREREIARQERLEKLRERERAQQERLEKLRERERAEQAETRAEEARLLLLQLKEEVRLLRESHPHAP